MPSPGRTRCAKGRFASKQLLTNPHSPAEYRVSGIVHNVDT
jgi:predicted metalloendopeptidase